MDSIVDKIEVVHTAIQILEGEGCERTHPRDLRELGIALRYLDDLYLALLHKFYLKERETL